MTFKEALIEIKKGKIIRPGKSTKKFLFSKPSNKLPITDIFVYCMTNERQIIPWRPNSWTLEFNGWEIYNGQLPRETEIEYYPYEPQKLKKIISEQRDFLRRKGFNNIFQVAAELIKIDDLIPF